MKTEFEENIALLKENALCGLVTVEGIFFQLVRPSSADCHIGSYLYYIISAERILERINLKTVGFI